MSDLLQKTGALAILLVHMHKKFEINRTKIKGQSGRKVVTPDSKSDLPLVYLVIQKCHILIDWKTKTFGAFR